MTYIIYGLRVQAEEPILGPAAINQDCFDLKLTFARLHASLKRSPGSILRHCKAVSIRRTDLGYHFAYADGYEFLVSPAGDRVTASIPDNGTLEDASTYILGPVMGLVLRLKGVVSLHASAIIIDGKAVAFCGGPGAGKSTTAAAFAKRGYPVLAEDISALDDRGTGFAIFPGYPRVNLWPESATALCGSAESLPAITPNWTKRYLPLSGDARFHSEPAPLAAIYVIGARQPERHPYIHPLRPAEAAIALSANTYTAHLQDRDMRAGDFALMSRLAQHVPVRRVLPPADIADIGRLCEGLVDDYCALASLAAEVA